MARAGLFVDDSAVTTDLDGLTAVALMGRHEFDAAMAVPVVVPLRMDGNGYQITPELVLNRRHGRKQWTYSIDCKEIECQLKARQSYEQQSGVASYSVGAAFWEVRAGKG